MVDLDGDGLLALWNGVDPSRQREYDIWHSREHVLERISVPGMLGARRYKRVAGSLPDYLTLYSMRDTDVLQSEPYQKLLQGPTEWSRSMRPAFRGFTRLCCRRVASFGGGAGGVLCAILVDDTVDLRSTELHHALRGLLALDPFVAVHVIERDMSVPDVPFRIGGDAPDFPDHGAIMIEGFDEAIFTDGIPDILAALDASNVHAAATLTTYRLAYALDTASFGRLVLPVADEERIGKGMDARTGHIQRNFTAATGLALEPVLSTPHKSGSGLSMRSGPLRTSYFCL